MREIGDLIREYCAQKLPAESNWITILNRRFPKIAARIDIVKSMQWEIDDHLRNSFEEYLSKGYSPEDAWKLAKEHFGDLALISREICLARTQSRRCLLIRFLAMGAFCVMPTGKLDPIHISWFISGKALLCLCATVAAGLLITRKRDADSLRKYAFCGAWIGLILGMIKAITVDSREFAGEAVALILISVFYGLFLAAPAARGIVAAAMIAMCHIGILIPLIRFGMLAPGLFFVDARLLNTAAVASVVSILFGFIVFGIRKLHRRLTAIAVFGMFICYVWIFRNFRLCSGLELVLTTSILFLITALMILPIRKLQKHLLREAA